MLADTPRAAVLKQPTLLPPGSKGVGPFILGFQTWRPISSGVHMRHRHSLLLSVHSPFSLGLGGLFIQADFWPQQPLRPCFQGPPGVTAYSPSKLSQESPVPSPCFVSRGPLARSSCTCPPPGPTATPLPSCLHIQFGISNSHMPSAAGEVSSCHSSPSSFAMEDSQKCKRPPSLKSHAVYLWGRQGRCIF